MPLAFSHATSTSALLSIALIAGDDLYAQEFSFRRDLSASSDGYWDLADVDGDGAMDVVSSRYPRSAILWYRNTDGLGGLRSQVIVDLTTPINQPAGSTPSISALAVGDVNGDGRPDVMAGWGSVDALGWFENLDAAGSFGSLQQLPLAVENPLSLQLADINGDGALDALPILGGLDELAWYENTDGLGAFGSRNDIGSVASQYASLHCGDMDGDGDMDIAFAHLFGSTASWYENLDGAGTFSAEQSLTASGGVRTGVDLGDMDGDGDLDVATSSVVGMDWIPNLDGAGTFGPPNSVISPLNSEEPYARDLDRDGDLDLLTHTDGLFGVSMGWLENTSGAGAFGTYQAFGPRLGSPGSTRLLTADMNGDGAADVVSGTDYLYAPSDALALHLNVAGDGSTWGDDRFAQSVNWVEACQAVDLDGDGDVDVLAASFGDNRVVWFENLDGAGAFDIAKIIVQAPTSVAHALAADFDGDGDPDVLGLDRGADAISLSINVDGQANFALPQLLPTTGYGPEDAQAADMDGDGDLDVLACFIGSDELGWLENVDGFGTFGAQQLIPSSVLSPAFVRTVDLDGDGDIDVVSASVSTPRLTWQENLSGDGSSWVEHALPSPFPLPLNLRDLLIIDVENDGDPDLIFTSNSSNPPYWLEHLEGSTAFEESRALPFAGSAAGELTAVDLEGDGDLDLLVSSDAELTWLQNRGGFRGFAARNVAAGGRSGDALAAGDFDGDGDPDVVLGFISDARLSFYAQESCGSDPSASFQPSVKSGAAGLEVAFTNTSTGTDPLTWLWDFGDGGTSTAENPVYVYSSEGSFDVSLTVSGPAGTCTVTQLGMILIGDCGYDPVADFTATPLTGDAPLTVQFSDSSRGSGIQSWSWDFGDGVNSAEASPLHTYLFPGTFTVSLEVLGDCGTCAVERDTYIVVTSDGTASVNLRNGSGVNPSIFTSQTLPILGTSWQSTVDGTSLAGSGLVFLLGYARPLDGTVTPFGELLVDPTSGLQVIETAILVAEQADFSVDVPNDVSLAGFPVSTQVLLNQARQLTNALDLILGN